MFEITSLETEKVKIFGKEYDAKKPTVKQVKELQKKLTAKDAGNEAIDTMLDFFAEIGLPKADLENVSISQLTKLIEHFSGAKKN